MKQTLLIPLTVTVLLAGLVVGVGVLWPKTLGPRCTPVRGQTVASLGMARFADTTQHTSLTLQTDASAKDAGAFVYETPAGARYSGGAVQGLRGNGDSAATCAGLLQVSYTGAAQLFTPNAAGTSDTQTSASVSLHATINLNKLVATIRFQDQTRHLTFNTTTQAPPDAAATATRFNQSTVKQDWPAVYQGMAANDTQGLTVAQFTAQIQAQEQQSGTITAISVTSGPTVGSTPQGVIYFIENERVTSVLNGSTSVTNVASVYVLENGAWRFLFSKTL